MTKEWAAVLICARIRGILARNRVRAKLTEVPHVVSITVIGAEGLSKTSLFMSPTPDAFVIANALAGSKDSLKKKKKNKCYSSAQTGVKEQSYNPQWQEDMRLTMVGMGNLVFNVFSRDSFGNSFLGQAVLNMYEHPSLYQDGAPVKVTIPVELPKYPIYNNKGELMSITPVSAPQGHITISCRVPSIYSNMCGWFTDIRANFFGAIGGVLVVLSIVFLDKIKIDDPVGAISVHGTCGLLGLLLVPLTNDGVSFSGQIIGAITIFVWVFGASLIVWGILKMVMGIRVSEEEEAQGIDISETGLEAYPEFRS